MLDIKFVRENPELVKENIKKKFQDAKLPLVDEAIELDRKNRAAIAEASDLRAKRNALSKANGPLFGKLKKAEGAEKDAIQAQIDANMAEVKADDERLAALEQQEGTLYYDTARDDLAQIFNTENFMLGEDTLTLFFNTYDIAPHAVGPQFFDIPFADLADILQDWLTA